MVLSTSCVVLRHVLVVKAYTWTFPPFATEFVYLRIFDLVQHMQTCRSFCQLASSDHHDAHTCAIFDSNTLVMLYNDFSSWNCFELRFFTIFTVRSPTSWNTLCRATCHKRAAGSAGSAGSVWALGLKLARFCYIPEHVNGVEMDFRPRCAHPGPPG